MTFNAQYGGLAVRTSKNFHDRFLIIDNKELYLIGASMVSELYCIFGGHIWKFGIEG